MLELWFGFAGYGALESARAPIKDALYGSLQETCRVSTTPTLKARMMVRNVFLEVFQFGLDNAVMVAHLTEKSTEERNAATLMIDIVEGTEAKTAAAVASMSVTDQARLGGLKVLCAEFTVNTSGRARAIVREDTERNGQWSMGLDQALFGTNTGATCFDKVF